MHFCCVPGCSNNSRRDSHLSFFTLPLKRKSILRQWVHRIGRKNLSLNSHTRVCSKHFLQANGRLLRPDEIPTLNLPGSITSISKRKPPKERQLPFVSRVSAGNHGNESVGDDSEEQLSLDASTQTETSIIEGTAEKVAALEVVFEPEAVATKVLPIEY